jgi:protoporphyrinogen oxidase
MSVPQKVAVLGGGPAGLAAGHELAKGGVHVTVYERAPWVGGLSFTWEHEGFRFDLGGHRWFTKKDWLQNWFLELMEGELVTVDRISRIYFGGRYFDYPVKFGNVLREAGLFTCAHAFLSYVASAIRKRLFPEEIENIEQAYVDQFGPKLYEMFFRRYTEKVWGRPCTELSADWVAQRTKGMSVVETVRNAIAAPKQKVESLVDQFVYPRLGYQRISERMKDVIEGHGGDVRLESTVVGVDCVEDGVIVRAKDRDGNVSESRFDHIISTIPLGRLVQITTPKAPDCVLAAAKGLEFRSVITANIMLQREQVTPDTWLYVHDESIGFARIHEPKNWSPDMVPSASQTSVVTEWFCSEGDEVWQLPDEDIVERTVKHLADDLGFIDRSEVIEGLILRARHAYPVYSLDYGERVGLIKGHLQTQAELLSIAGRGGTFRYNNADHSIETGILVGRNLLGGSYDVDAVNTEQEYHEERIVER